MALDTVGVGSEERVEMLRKVVDIGERNLGPKAFEEGKGCFWGLLETRPYMRARAQLALVLRDAGRWDEAIAEWEAMLELNPNDNQGMRYDLLAGRLRLGRLDAARGLLARYDECRYSTTFAWGKVLERFLSGDHEGATQALAVARKQNQHTEPFVTGQRKLPKSMPGGYSPGSEDEAICFAQGLRAAWECHPDSLRWLSEQK